MIIRDDLKPHDRTGPRRWPLQPLLDLLSIETDDEHWSARVSLFVGYTSRSVQRWRNDGLTDWVADHVAHHMGIHPWTIWDDWIDIPLTLLDDVA